MQRDYLCRGCEDREFGLGTVSSPSKFWKPGTRFFLGNRSPSDLVDDPVDLATSLTKRSLKRSALAGTLRRQALSLSGIGREIPLNGARLLELRLERGHYARLNRCHLVGLALGAATSFLASAAIDAAPRLFEIV